MALPYPHGDTDPSETHHIDTITAATKDIKLKSAEGDVTSHFPHGYTFTVTNTSSNNGTYTVDSTSYVSSCTHIFTEGSLVSDESPADGHVTDPDTLGGGSNIDKTAHTGTKGMMVAPGETATSAHANRAHWALSANENYLYGLVSTDLSVLSHYQWTSAGDSSKALTAVIWCGESSSIYPGSAGSYDLDHRIGMQALFAVLDDHYNDLKDTDGSFVRVRKVHLSGTDKYKTGFVTNPTVDFHTVDKNGNEVTNPYTIPASQIVRLVFAIKGTIETLPIDAFSRYITPTFGASLDHGILTGLADDDHSQYALLGGRAGGQTLSGGTLASQTLTLKGTSNVSGGDINIPANNNLTLAGGKISIQGDNDSETPLTIISSNSPNYPLVQLTHGYSSQLSDDFINCTIRYTGGPTYKDALTVDHYGKLLLNAYTSTIQSTDEEICIYDWVDGTRGARITLGTAQDESTKLSSNKPAGEILFRGFDGTNWIDLAKLVGASDNLTTGTDDMPGKFRFYLRSDGTGKSLTERFSIDSTGLFTFQSDGTNYNLKVKPPLLEDGFNPPLDMIEVPALTVTIDDGDNVRAAGINLISIYQPTYSKATSATITNAATLYLDNCPVGGGAGPITITNAYTLWVDNGTSRFDGYLLSSLDAKTSGSNPAVKVLGAAHTGQTAGTELIDVNFSLSATLQFATGAIATQRTWALFARKYGFVAASTITSAITGYISGAPRLGTNATFDNAYGLYIDNTTLEGSTTIGTAASLYIKGAPVSGGTITNSYSLLVDAGSTRLDGALEVRPGGSTNVLNVTYDGADKIGFFNATPQGTQTGWSVTNVTEDKSFDADSTTLDEIADVLGTLITRLKALGLISA